MKTTRVAFAVVLTMVSTYSHAVAIDTANFDALVKKAKMQGAVPVMVQLASPTLDALNKDLVKVKIDMKQRAQRLVAELGQEAWSGAQWENDTGQMGLYLTPAGLNALRASGNAESFGSGRSWVSRTHLLATDGSLAELENQVLTNGWVDLVVTLNLDGLEYDQLSSGAIAFRNMPARRAEIGVLADAVLGAMNASDTLNLSDARDAVNRQTVSQTNPVPNLTLRVNYQGLIKLGLNAGVRKLTPVAWSQRPRAIENDAFATAKKHGVARVILTIRAPLDSTRLSKRSWTNMVDSNRRALKEISQQAGLESLDFVPEFGASMGEVTLAGLERLQASTDARLASVSLSRADSVSLESSAISTNVTRLWNNNPPLRAAGQNIIVIDTGISKAHPFFQNASGASRVIYEACFGTTGNQYVDNVNVGYVSSCSSPDGNGDSTPGLLDSAEPSTGTVCGASFNHNCNHGNHVAGIAAGRWASGQPTNRQGVAPDANIVAVKIASYDPNGLHNVVLDRVDQLKALQMIVTAMTPGIANPYVINLSLGSNDGSGISSFNCSYTNLAYNTAISQLKGLGVPVIAVVGNESQIAEINYPACVPGVIKVGAVTNPLNPVTTPPERSVFSNSADLFCYPNEIFVMAPGGGAPLSNPFVSTTVMSSTRSSTGTFTFEGMSGTSMSAPTVAGLYAAYKAAVPGATVDNASAWITSASASVPMSIQMQPLCGGTSYQNIPRMKIAN